jgi:LSD1 subclass zinc finger protein
MSADGLSPTPPNALQFDIAESAATSNATRAEMACKGCGSTIAGAYYQVNRSVICERCRAVLQHPPGSRVTRALRAAGFGLAAAIAGSVLYFAVRAITGFEFGLVAIAVGFMVGTAVRRGSGGRGGWAYQTLAIALTYLAIVSTYVPLLISEFQKSAKQSAIHAAAPTPMDTISISASGPESGDSANASGDSSAMNRVAQAGTPAAARSARAHATRLGAGTVLLGIGTLVLLAAVVPIAAGFSNLIGLLIIAIAVFEAWKLNRRAAISGPYLVGGAARPRPQAIG